MKKGPLYVLICYICWGLFPIFWKQLSGVDSIYVLASRVVWSFVFCLFILAFRKKFGELISVLKDVSEMKKLLLAAVMVTFNWGFYIAAIHQNHILEGSLAYYMNPILTVILGYILYSERLSFRQKFAVIIATAGVLYQVVMYGSFPAFALIIGGSFAVYGAVKKNVKASSEVSLFVETLLIFPVAIAYMAYAKYNGFDGVDSLGVYKFLLPLSGAVTSIPLLFFAIGIKTTSLSTSGILMYINPTLQFLVGVLIYGEEFSKTNAVAFIFIWAALIVYIPTVVKMKNRKLNI